MEKTLNKVWQHGQSHRKERNCLIAVFLLITAAQGIAAWIS